MSIGAGFAHFILHCVSFLLLHSEVLFSITEFTSILLMLTPATVCFMQTIGMNVVLKSELFFYDMSFEPITPN